MDIVGSIRKVENCSSNMRVIGITYYEVLEVLETKLLVRKMKVLNRRLVSTNCKPVYQLK